MYVCRYHSQHNSGVKSGTAARGHPERAICKKSIQHHWLYNTLKWISVHMSSILFPVSIFSWQSCFWHSIEEHQLAWSLTSEWGVSEWGANLSIIYTPRTEVYSLSKTIEVHKYKGCASIAGLPSIKLRNIHINFHTNPACDYSSNTLNKLLMHGQCFTTMNCHSYTHYLYKAGSIHYLCMTICACAWHVKGVKMQCRHHYHMPEITNTEKQNSMPILGPWISDDCLYTPSHIHMYVAVLETGFSPTGTQHKWHACTRSAVQ